MNRFIKYFYVFITMLFAVLTAYEIYIYMSINSNYFGIIYLFLNFFVMFLLFTITINYKEGSKKIRVSKNVVVIIIGIISSFILTLILPKIFNYSDDTYLFNDKVFIISKLIKPIIYLSLGVISALENKNFRKRNL